MKNGSSLNSLFYYASDNGMDVLYKEFIKELESQYFDKSKGYDTKTKIMYLFTPEFKESYPYSFDDHVKQKIIPLFNSYSKWLRELFETQEKDKILSIIVDHKERIRKLFNSIDDENTLPRVALKKIAYQLADYHQKLTTGETLEQQREKVTKTKIYERYWELILGPEDMSRDKAFTFIYSWLTEELLFSETQLEKLKVNFNKKRFFRNANGEKVREIKNRISVKYSDG